MKIIHHEGNPTRTSSKYVKPVTFAINPMTVWLDRHHQLLINKGDRLDAITPVVKEWFGLKKKAARLLVAYWFALGERAVAKKTGRPTWKKSELSTDPARRYLR